CEDASRQVRAILLGRYSTAELERLDAEGRGLLLVYAMDIALYRVALSFSRLTDEIRERHTSAVKRLEGIAAGRGGLSFTGGNGQAVNSPNGVVVDAPERFFTRERMRF